MSADIEVKVTLGVNSNPELRITNCFHYFVLPYTAHIEITSMVSQIPGFISRIEIVFFFDLKGIKIRLSL